MSKPTLTAPFDFTVFGAVSCEVSKTAQPRVEIPEALSKAFAEIVSFLATPGVENTNKIKMEMPDKAAADLLRWQVQQYADDNGLTAYLPKWADAHWNRKEADAVTGEYTDKETGKVVQAKWIPANGGIDPKTGKWKGVEKSWNVGTNVTFRITKPKPKDATAPKSGNVTVTHTEPKPATEPSPAQLAAARIGKA
jgi:hypothetical protein